MRILHTSDWHLGKRTSNKPRLDEQRVILDEIVGIATDAKADVLLLAGDVFDTFVPPAEAEEVFYSTMLRLSKVCLPVVIAGNHDDASRLTAPEGFARMSGVLLMGENRSVSFATPSASVVTEGDCATITIRGETLALGCFGFPSDAHISAIAGDANYADAVGAAVLRACRGFREGGINMFMSHLFVTGAENSLTDERELGGSKLVPLSYVTPDYCAYTALGHIHKPMPVSREKAVYYSGSIARYDFGDSSEKRVILVDTDGTRTDIKSIPLTSPKRLVKVRVDSEQAAIAALEQEKYGYVLLEYDSPVPLSSRAVSAFRKFDCFCGVEAIAIKRDSGTIVRRGKTDAELFAAYYERKCSRAPDPETVELFLRALSGAEL